MYFSRKLRQEAADTTKTGDGMHIATLDDLLAASQAEAAFKAAVRSFEAGSLSPLISFFAGAPRVKVLRVVMKILHEYPDEPIKKIHVEGRSGCATFAGLATIQPGDKSFRFAWDCAWRANVSQLTNIWGIPDQVRAAREYGYQCFRGFEEIKAEI